MKVFATTFFAIIIALLAGCTQIDTGNVGVERTMGRVETVELPPGVYNTVFKSVDEITTKEVAIEMKDMRPKSSDNLTIQDLDIDIYYKVAPDKAADLYVKYQGDLIEIKGGDLAVGYNRVVREAREAIYRAVSLFPATTMHTKRQEIAEEVRKNLQVELDAFDKGSFTVTNINVRNLVTDQALEDAIRARVQVDQQIEAKLKQNELAKAEAARLLIEAQGQANANNAITASITPNLLRLREIEAMQAVAAKNGNTTIVVPASGVGTLLNVGK